MVKMYFRVVFVLALCAQGAVSGAAQKPLFLKTGLSAWLSGAQGCIKSSSALLRKGFSVAWNANGIQRPEEAAVTSAVLGALITQNELLFRIIRNRINAAPPAPQNPHNDQADTETRKRRVAIAEKLKIGFNCISYILTAKMVLNSYSPYFSNVMRFIGVAPVEVFLAMLGKRKLSTYHAKSILFWASTAYCLYACKNRIKLNRETVRLYVPGA